MAKGTLVTILVAFVLMIGVAALYVMNLRGDLETAQSEVQTLSAETVRLQAELAKKPALDMAGPRAEEKSVKITEELTLLRQELDGANSQIAALQNELRRAENSAHEARIVAGQWRDLFDYSRARNSRTADARANPSESVSMANADKPAGP